MSKEDKPDTSRRRRVRPGSTLRLELHLSTFVCLQMPLTCRDVGELVEMLISEAVGDDVAIATKSSVQRVFDRRDDFRIVRGGFGRATTSLAIRREVFERDGRQCRYCGQAIEWADYHCDHVEPVSKGGSGELSNLAASCAPCNLAKAAKPLDVWQQ